MEYAIKIDGKYFKDYVYADENIAGRFGKGRILAGDIIDIVLTDQIERTEVGRSLGNTITTLYTIEAMRGKGMEVVAIGGLDGKDK